MKNALGFSFCLMICIGVTAAECKPGKAELLPIATVKRLLDTPGYSSTDEALLRTLGDATARSLARIPSLAKPTERAIAQATLLVRLSFSDTSAIAWCDDSQPNASLKLIKSLADFPLANRSEISNDIRMLEFAATGQPLRNVSLDSTDWKNTQWIAAIMRSISWIKPGMTRADVLTVFTTEGGISTISSRTYVHKLCPYIKVTVEFAVPPAAREERAEDVIKSISRPYLAYSVMD
jgi:hypothetical protein